MWVTGRQRTKPPSNFLMDSGSARGQCSPWCENATTLHHQDLISIIQLTGQSDAELYTRYRPRIATGRPQAISGSLQRIMIPIHTFERICRTSPSETCSSLQACISLQLLQIIFNAVFCSHAAGNPQMHLQEYVHIQTVE